MKLGLTCKRQPVASPSEIPATRHEPSGSGVQLPLIFSLAGVAGKSNTTTRSVSPWYFLHTRLQRGKTLSYNTAISAAQQLYEHPLKTSVMITVVSRSWTAVAGFGVYQSSCKWVAARPARDLSNRKTSCLRGRLIALIHSQRPSAAHDITTNPATDRDDSSFHVSTLF